MIESEAKRPSIADRLGVRTISLKKKAASPRREVKIDDAEEEYDDEEEVAVPVKKSKKGTEIDTKIVIKATHKEKKIKLKKSPKVIMVADKKKARRLLTEESAAAANEGEENGIKARLKLKKPVVRKGEPRIQLYKPPPLQSSGK